MAISFPKGGLIMCFCLFTFQVQGKQKYLKFSHLTVQQGLTSNTVNSVTKDFRGFIWVATENGVSRYNGYSFVNYNTVYEDSTSISSNSVFAIIEDRKQRLWVCSGFGLDLYNRDLDRFDTHLLQGVAVRNVLCDKYGQLWIASEKGLYMYNDTKKKLTKPFGNLFDITLENKSFNSVSYLLEDTRGNLWIGTTHGGVYLYDDKVNAIKIFYHDKRNPGSISCNKIRQIIEDNLHRIWIATFGGGVNLYQPETQSFKKYLNESGNLNSLSNNLVNTIYAQNDGCLWIGTDGNGIDILDTKTDLIHHYTYSKNHPQSLNNNVIRSITSDNAGSLWIGTHTGGINFYSENTEKFVHYKIIDANGNNSITSFARESNGNIYIGTDGGGLFYFNKKFESFSKIVYEKTTTGGNGFSKVISLLLDHHGYLWIGTYLDGLYRYDPRTETSEKFFNGEKLLPGENIIWYMLEDSKNRIWIATENGLKLFIPSNKRFKSFRKQNSNLGSNEIRTLYEDSRHRFWIGTVYGLYMLNVEDSTFKIIETPRLKKGLSNWWIRSITEDIDGGIWIGTFTEGLNYYNEKNKCIDIRFGHHFPNSTISAILCDSKNVLWVSTGNGLYYIRVNDGTVQNYFVDDGLQDNQFNINACCKTLEGELIFGGINGFNIFYPEEIKNIKVEKNNSSIVLTSFKIFNKEIHAGQQNSPLNRQISETKSLVLSYCQTMLTFEFAALNYIQPEKNHYSYRLVGLESEWNHAGNKHFASYTNLKPGEYVFQVRASNSTGAWGPNDVNLKITIKPPFWGTLWFKSIIALIFLVAVIILIIILKKRIREKIEISKIIAQLKIKALMAQMNPHFVFNCLNSIQELIAIDNRENAMHYLNQFSCLLRTVLQCSQKNFIPLYQELNLIKIYLELESMRFNGQFNYTVDVDFNIDEEEVFIPTFMIQPFVENALWHGLMHKKGERYLNISFSFEDENLLCRISDNGIGRGLSEHIKKKLTHKSDSLGIKIIQERIELFKNQGAPVYLKFIDEKDEKGNANGTTVILKLPVSHYTDRHENLIKNYTY